MGKLPEFLKRKNNFIILIIIGVLLLVVAIPTGDNKKEHIEKEVATEYSEDYASKTEKRLEKVLAEIHGAGKVQVLISWQASSEKLVEKDENKTVYLQSSGGEQSPFIRQEIMPKAEGVIVVAEGGDNPVVVRQITEAVCALFGVDTHKIKIMKGG